VFEIAEEGRAAISRSSADREHLPPGTVHSYPRRLPSFIWLALASASPPSATAPAELSTSSARHLS
jgi:hypothetical protein